MGEDAGELKRYTDEEFYEYLENNNVRAELIDGFIILDMGTPSILHQELVYEFKTSFKEYFRKHGKKCRAYMGNEVRLDSENVVVPDIFVTCKTENVDKKRMNGAPEFVLEIVSSNSANDYFRKLNLYKQFGVREYRIVDPRTEHVTVWYFEDEESPTIYGFSEDIAVRCCEDGEPLVLNITELIKNAY